jgi:hypothetical protein
VETKVFYGWSVADSCCFSEALLFNVYCGKKQK